MKKVVLIYRLLIFNIITLLSIMIFATNPLLAQSSCKSSYQLQTNSGEIYGLIGITDQFANQTQANVTGNLLPYNASDYLQPQLNYGGTIVVQSLQVGATAYNYNAINVTSISSFPNGTTVTSTGIQTISSPSPVTTVSGLLIYSFVPCIQPLAPGQNVNYQTIVVLVSIVVVVILAFTFYFAKIRKK